MYFCLDAAGPILLWFMVGFQQIHFLAGRELTLTGLICLVLNQSVNQLINQSISYLNYKSAMQVSVQWVIVKNSSPPPTVGRQSADRSPTVYRQVTDRLPTGYRQAAKEKI